MDVRENITSADIPGLKKAVKLLRQQRKLQTINFDPYERLAQEIESIISGNSFTCKHFYVESSHGGGTDGWTCKLPSGHKGWHSNGRSLLWKTGDSCDSIRQI